MIGDLTTLANVTAWLNAGTTAPYPPDGNPLLARLITACSGFVQNYLNRNIVPAVYNETYNGTGQSVLFLRNRPIISVQSLSIDGVSIASSPSVATSGFIYDESMLYVRGYLFGRGIQNVTVAYTSGLQAQTSQTIPADGAPLKVTGFPLPWNADMGVTVDGVAFTAITSGTPSTGEYLVDVASDGAPQYTFAVADANGTAVIDYGYTPYDLEQVVIETVGEAFKRRNRIGQMSVNMGDGQVVSFSLADFNASSKALLNQYRNVVPV